MFDLDPDHPVRLYAWMIKATPEDDWAILSFVPERGTDLSLVTTNYEYARTKAREMAKTVSGLPGIKAEIRLVAFKEAMTLERLVNETDEIYL